MSKSEQNKSITDKSNELTQSGYEPKSAGYEPGSAGVPPAPVLTLDDYSYDLPPELIAQEPSAERSASHLMVLARQSKTIEHRQFGDITEYLRAGDVLVLNDTRVIPARIIARRATGGIVEIQLLKPDPTKPGIWQAMASPLRKLKVDEELFVQLHEEGAVGYEGAVGALRSDGSVGAVGSESLVQVIRIAGFYEAADSQRRVLLDFGSQAQIHSLLSKIGHAPLPPYILRQRAEKKNEQHNLSDLERYQTVFARVDGAVAAPTAGLHFSSALLEQLKQKGVKLAFLTLHVGPGTFKPIASSVAEHTIEAEEFYISEETASLINRCREEGGRVVAVGTTSCRALESAGSSGTLQAVNGSESSLYIREGHKFAMVDLLITNFHLSKSSLLVLVSAFAGHEFIMSAYQEAIEREYRFYSYGDAMLIL